MARRHPIAVAIKQHASEQARLASFSAIVALGGVAGKLGLDGPSHRMRAIGRAIKPSARDPRMDDPGILPSREVWLHSDPAGKEVTGVPVSHVGKPRLDRGPIDTNRR